MAGEPTYIELGVPDTERARAFYGAVLGWVPSGSSGNGNTDTDTLSIGLHGGDADRHFEVFFAVENLGTAMELVTSNGGTIVAEPRDAGAFGRYVECTDDQGVRFGLHQRP